MRFKFIFFIFLFSFLVVGQTASAECSGVGSVPWIEQATGITDGLIIPCACLGDQGGKNVNVCGLNELFQTIVNFSQVLLALTGTAALLMFVYGGTMMILAGTSAKGDDNKKKINRGKDAIMAAIIGITVVLGAWLIVNFTIIALTGGDIDSPAKIFGNKDPFAAPSGQ